MTHRNGLELGLKHLELSLNDLYLFTSAIYTHRKAGRWSEDACVAFDSVRGAISGCLLCRSSQLRISHLISVICSLLAHKHCSCGCHSCPSGPALQETWDWVSPKSISHSPVLPCIRNMPLHRFLVEKQKEKEQRASNSPSWPDMGQDQEGGKAENGSFHCGIVRDLKDVSFSVAGVGRSTINVLQSLSLR